VRNIIGSGIVDDIVQGTGESTIRDMRLSAERQVR